MRSSDFPRLLLSYPPPGGGGIDKKLDFSMKDMYLVRVVDKHLCRGRGACGRVRFSCPVFLGVWALGPLHSSLLKGRMCLGVFLRGRQVASSKRRKLPEGWVPYT